MSWLRQTWRRAGDLWRVSGVAQSGTPSPPNKLIVIAGQSNCTGMDDYANITNANAYGNSWANVQGAQWITTGAADPIAFTVAGTRAALGPRAAAGQNNFGPELALMRHLDLVKPGIWRFTKWGINSSSLATNWKPTGTYPTNPTGGPNLFTQMMSDIAAQAVAMNAAVAAFVWIQGEQDALDPTMSAAYQSNLIAFFDAVRATYPNLPIVMARIPASSPETYNGTVYTAQNAVAAATSNCTLVNTDDLVPLITTYHFSANNLVTFGHRLASAVLGLLGIADIYKPVAWTTDGDGVGFPQSVAEWQAVLSAAGVPTTLTPFAIYDLTVASGNAPDLLGGVALAASGTGATYQASAAGFTRKGISTPDAATFKLATADASYPNVQTESMALLSYVRLNADTGTFRNLTSMGLAAGTRMKAAMKGGGLPNPFEGNTNNTSGTKKPAGAVRPMFAQHNVTAAQGVWADELEYLTITFDATVAGKGLEILGGTNSAPNAVTLYAAALRGAAAEWTQAQLRSIQSVLRWQVQW